MGKSRRNKKPFDPIAVFVEKSSNNDFKWVPNKNREAGSDQPLGFFHVYQFKCDCNHPYWSDWESADIYAAKGEYCENPKCAEKLPLLPCAGPFLSRTPCYSAEGRFYGRFQCPNPACKLSWNSALAFADTYQTCKKCETKAWSYDMTDEPLFTSGKGHMQKSCQKCKNKEEPCSVKEPGEKRVRGRGNWNRYFLRHTNTNETKKNNKGNNKKGGKPQPPPDTPPSPPSSKPSLDTPPSPPSSKPPTVVIKTAMLTSGQTVEVTKKKKKRKSGGGKKKNNGNASTVKCVSPAPSTEGKMVKIIQDLEKMAFPKKDNEAKAPKID